jgi:PAS domain S-box-containing protein
MSRQDAGLEPVPFPPDAERDAARLRAVIDTGSAAIAAIDPLGVVTLWGAGAEQVTGRPARDAVGSPLSTLLEGVELEPLLEGSSRRGGSTGELAVVRKDYNDIRVALHANPILDLTGQHLETVVVLEDVSDERRLEEELRESRELFHAGGDTVEAATRIEKDSPDS